MPPPRPHDVCPPLDNGGTSDRSHHQAFLYITRHAGLVMYRQGW